MAEVKEVNKELVEDATALDDDEGDVDMDLGEVDTLFEETSFPPPPSAAAPPPPAAASWRNHE